MVGQPVPTFVTSITGNEQQKITVLAPAGTTGAMTIGYATLSTTATFDQNPDIFAANIQSAIATMLGVGAGTDVIVTHSTPVGDTTDYFVNFQGVLANSNLASLTANASAMTPGSTAQANTLFDGAGNSVFTMSITGSPGQNTRLRVTIPGQAAVDARVRRSMKFRPSRTLPALRRLANLRFRTKVRRRSFWTTIRPPARRPARCSRRLEALPTIGAGNVVVTSTGGPTSHGGPYQIEFTGTLGKININEGTDGINVNNIGTNFQRTITQQGGTQISMPFSSNTSPTAAQVQAHLQSIPALAQKRNSRKEV